GLLDRHDRREHAWRQRLRPVRPVRRTVVIEVGAGAAGDQVRGRVELAVGIAGLVAGEVAGFAAGLRAVGRSAVLVRATAEVPGRVAWAHRISALEPRGRGEVPDFGGNVYVGR